MISPASPRERRTWDIPALLAARTPAPAALPPLTPAGYIRARRAAAMLSIAQVAERIEPRVAARGDVARILRLLERDGVAASNVETLRPLAPILRLDLDVYAQLRDVRDAARHPNVCRACGCSAGNPCRIVDMATRAPCECTLDSGLCSICERYGESRQ